MKLTRFLFSLVLLVTVLFVGLRSISAQDMLIDDKKPKCECYIPQIDFKGVWADSTHNACTGSCQ